MPIARTPRCAGPLLKAAALAAIALSPLESPLLAAPMQPAADVAPVWRTDATGTRTEVKPLLSLVPRGQSKSVKRTGS